MKSNKTVTKKLVPLLVAGAMIMPMASYSNAMVKNDYKDHWASSTIQEWVEKGYIKGVGDQGVLPNKEITRAEFVRMVNMRFDYNEMAENNKFNDVEQSAWYYKDVMNAQKQGYIAGISSTQFGPNLPVSREQAATIVARIADVGSDEEALKMFSDESAFSDYAKGPIGAAAKQKLVSGYEDGTFKPKKVLTRAEAMVLLEKSYEISKSGMKEEQKEEQKQELKVTFDSNGGTSIEPQMVKKGEKVKRPKDPTKESTQFIGWFMDGVLFNFDTVIEKDIVLKAKWNESSGSSSSNNGSTPQKPLKPQQQKVNEIMEKALENVGEDNLKINIGGKTPNIDPKKPVTDVIKENLDQVSGELNKANEKINKKLEEMQKFYLSNKNPYATEDRFNEKLIKPLKKLELNDIAQVLEDNVEFENKKVKKVKDNTVKSLVEVITENAENISKLPLVDIQSLVNNIEEPYYSEDGENLKPVIYMVTLTIDDNAPITVQNGSSRDQMVKALHDFLKETQKPSKKFLSKTHSIKIDFESSIEGVKSVKDSITKTISPVVKLDAKIPTDTDLDNKTPQELNIPGVKTKEDVETLKSLKGKLKSELGITEKQLETGLGNIDFNKLKESVNKNAFDLKELELLKSLFGK